MKFGPDGNLISARLAPAACEVDPGPVLHRFEVSGGANFTFSADAKTIIMAVDDVTTPYPGKVYSI